MTSTTNKHQPCGKVGCLNCAAPITGSYGPWHKDNPWHNIANEPQTREQMHGILDSVQPRDPQREKNVQMEELLAVAMRKSKNDYPPVTAPLLKLILRQMAYFLFLLAGRCSMGDYKMSYCGDLEAIGHEGVKCGERYYNITFQCRACSRKDIAALIDENEKLKAQYEDLDSAYIALQETLEMEGGQS